MNATEDEYRVKSGCTDEYYSAISEKGMSLNYHQPFT